MGNEPNSSSILVQKRPKLIQHTSPVPDSPSLSEEEVLLPCILLPCEFKVRHEMNFEGAQSSCVSVKHSLRRHDSGALTNDSYILMAVA